MCTTATTRMCAFKWQLPCNMDSDCGGGFACKPSVSGSCSSGGSSGTGTGGGSGGAPNPGVPTPMPADAGAALVAPPPMCTTKTSYPGSCQPTVTTCSADSDCPAHWKCVESSETPVSNGGATRPAIPLPPDAGAPRTKVCASSFAPPQRGDKEEGGTTTAPGGGNGGLSQDDKAPPPVAPLPVAAKSDAGATPTPAKPSGCSMADGAGGSGAGLTVLALLGLALGRRRRG